MSTIEAQEAAQGLLDGLKGTLPWKFHQVEQPENWKGSPILFGSIRTPGGKNVLQPYEGSNSTLMLPVPIKEFVINAPLVIKALMDRIEQLEADVEIAETKVAQWEEAAMAKAVKATTRGSKKTIITPDIG